MARILVAGPDSVVGRDAQDRILARLRDDGHDAVPCTDPAREVPDADAVVALVGSTESAAAVGVAHGLGKPTLGLAGPDGTPAYLRGACTRTREAETVAGWLEALPDFYDDVRPFAGRLVRDLVPELVKEAGYAVTFRAVPAEDKPRFLKEKILEEAKALLAAAPGEEKEEIADVLEALETLIRARGYDREALKQVKDAKRKRRGGFERGWVVEATAGRDPGPEPETETETSTTPPEEVPTFEGDVVEEAPAERRQTTFFEV